MPATESIDCPVHRCDQLAGDLVTRLPVVLAVLLVVLIGAWLADPDLAYTTLERDSWMYHGYFLDIRGHLQTFGHCYYSSRLSLTVPGWIVYKCTPAAIANHTLHLLVYLTGVLGLYSTVRQVINARTALLAAVLLGGQFYYLQAASSDYCDGYILAYFCLAMAAAARGATSSRWRLWLTITGALAATLVVTNLSYVMLLPPLGLFLLVLNQSGPRHPVDAAGFWLITGWVGVMAGVAAASKMLGGPLNFLAASFSFLPHYTVNGPNPFHQDLSAWVGHASWLFLPAAAAIGALPYLITAWPRRRETQGARRICFQVMLLGMLPLLVGLELTSRGIFLQYRFYAVPLLYPLSMLAIAGQWGQWVEGQSPRAFLGLLGTAVALPIAGACVHLPASWVPPLMVFAALPVVAVLLPRVRPRLSVAVVALLLLAITDVTARLHFASFWWDHYGPRFPSEATRADMFRCVDATKRKALKLDPGYQAAYWYDGRESLGLVLDSVASMGCYRAERLVNTRYPALQPGTTNLSPGQRAFLLSSKADALEQARRTLAQLGCDARVLREWEVASGSLRFRSYLLETYRTPAGTAVSKRETR